jgi:hypothetical protein
MIVKQIPLKLHHPGDLAAATEVVLETKAIESIVLLMANALIAVVRAAEQTEEAADGR